MIWEDCRSFWPNARHSRFVRTGSHRWHLQDAGRGPCVLMLHGAGASTHSWRSVLPDLARDHRVVAIDLPGQGFTEVADTGRCGLDAMAADIAELLAAEGITPDVIVGHSAGAAIALRLALDLPRAPETVVAINGAFGNLHRPSSDLLSRLTMMAARTPLPAVGFSWMASSHTLIRLLISGTGSRLDRRGVDYYCRLLSDRRHVAATVAMMTQWDVAPLVAELPEVRSRVLFLVGDADLAVPPATSKAAARQVAEGRVETFHGLGHLLHEERPIEAAAAIRGFAAEVPDARRVG
ncbi:MAG: alpha/beta fold hydrolase BchO [Amaricoccus sp.]